MSDQLASELLKLRTTRTLALLLLAAGAMSLFGVSVEALSRDLGKLAPEEAQRDLFSGGVTIGVFFATLAGLLAVTSEFRYGTIRPTLIVEPRRRVVIAAKLAAAALAGVAFAVVCVGATFGAGSALLAARDVDLALTGTHTVVLVIGPVVASMISAMIGVAIGTLIRNQVGAVVALAAYALLVDAVLFAAVPSVGRYLPGKAGDALAGRPDELLLAPGVGAVVLIAWGLAFLAAATVRNDRSDVLTPTRAARSRRPRARRRPWCAACRRAAPSHLEARVPARGATARRGYQEVGREPGRRDQPGDHRVRVPHLARLQLVAPPHGCRHGRGELEEPAGEDGSPVSRRGPPTASARSGIDPPRQQRTS